MRRAEDLSTSVDEQYKFPAGTTAVRIPHERGLWMVPDVPPKPTPIGGKSLEDLVDQVPDETVGYQVVEPGRDEPITIFTGGVLVTNRKDLVSASYDDLIQRNEPRPREIGFKPVVLQRFGKAKEGIDVLVPFHRGDIIVNPSTKS